MRLRRCPTAPSVEASGRKRQVGALVALFLVAAQIAGTPASAAPTDTAPGVQCGQQYVSGKVIKVERGIVGILDVPHYNKYIEIPADHVYGDWQMGDWMTYELAEKQPYVSFYIGTCAQFSFRPEAPRPPPTLEELRKCRDQWVEGRVVIYNATKLYALLSTNSADRTQVMATKEVLEGVSLFEGQIVYVRLDGFGRACALQA